MQFIAQGPEEICLSLEHQNPSITSGSPFGEKKARKGKGKAGGGSFSLKIGLLGTPCLCRPSGDVPCASEDMACGY